MRKFIKKLNLLFIIMTLTLSLFGCGQSVDTSKNNQIPEDGIIKAEKFKEIKENNDVAFFNGENEDYKYQWMFVGSDIQTPKDTNLLISATKNNIDLVKKKTESEIVEGFVFEEKTGIDSKPALSITLNKSYDISSVDIYKYDESTKNIEKVSAGTVQNASKTIVNFSVLDREGEYYIVGRDPKGDAIEKDNKNNEDNNDTSKDNEGNNDTSEENSSKTESSSSSSSSSSSTNEGVKDKYHTDPIPEGKPKPVEPENSQVDKSKKKYATLSVRCDTLLKSENYKIACDNGKKDMIPSDGVIYAKKKVVFYEGESVFDVLIREMKNSKIHMEHEFTPMYNSAYIEGINNLYEFDGGELSGWMYKVNGWFPNYGCSRYQLKDGDVIEWVYTCDLGRDVGCEWLGDK